ncbi:hypothetical protein LWI28_004796 [Acer negundo]|uniref:Uncharacterized protein n=1 Tax=Acer negundo TaxID=4023 RepID=A0AAD5J2W0_ACENE|nr:hypothetical protein LWI28_004796 [Acer negundo]
MTSADDSNKSESNSGSGESKSTTQIVTIQGDNFNFSTRIKLDEHNYSLWHQVIEMKIAGREKHCHLTGDTTQPAATDLTYNKWRASDCQVKSWLFDAMQPNQMKRFIRYDTANQVWDAIKKTYSDGSDEAKIYDLHKRSFTMKQNGASIANYYSELTEIFQELDQLNPSNMKHPSDIEIRREEIDRLQVYIFLAGLENNFDQIRGEILRMKPKLELEAAYAHIKRESNRQGTMSEVGVTTEVAALIAARSKHSRPSTQNRTLMKCTKCGLDNHTVKGCYEVIGYLEGWVHKGRKKDLSRASFASAELSQEIISESSSGGDSGHPLQGENSIFAEDTQNHIIQILQNVSEHKQPQTTLEDVVTTNLPAIVVCNNSKSHKKWSLLKMLQKLSLPQLLLLYHHHSSNQILKNLHR